MNAIIQLYWQICRMRVGPDQVPTAITLTMFTFLTYLALSVGARLLIAEMPLDYTAVSIAAIVGLWVILVYGVLAFKGVASRFQQTFTAAIGTDVILTCFSLPLVILVGNVPENSPVASLGAILMLVIFIWDVLIKGFIFHHAFNVSPLQGNLFSFMLNFLILRMDQALLLHFVPEALEKV